MQDVIDNQDLEKLTTKDHWAGYIEYDEEYNLKAVFKKTSKNEIYLQTLFKVLKGRK